MEVPGGTHPDIVVAVAVPVVDVEVALVEVADARDVTTVDLRTYCFSSSGSTRIEFYCFCKPSKNLCTLLSVFMEKYLFYK